MNTEEALGALERWVRLAGDCDEGCVGGCEVDDARAALPVIREALRERELTVALVDIKKGQQCMWGTSIAPWTERAALGVSDAP